MISEVPANGSVCLVNKSYPNTTNALSRTVTTQPLDQTLGKVVDAIWGQKSEASVQALTAGESQFLFDLEVAIEVVRRVPKDARYLLGVRKVINAYMTTNQVQAFPAHMSQAIELLATRITGIQFNIIARDKTPFDVLPPLTDDCFLDQVNSVIKAIPVGADWAESKIAAGVVKTIIDAYFATREAKAFTPKVLEKFTAITKSHSLLFRMM